MRKILIFPQQNIPQFQMAYTRSELAHAREGLHVCLYFNHDYELDGQDCIIYLYKFHRSFYPGSDLYRRLGKYKQNSSSIFFYIIKIHEHHYHMLSFIKKKN